MDSIATGSKGVAVAVSGLLVGVSVTVAGLESLHAAAKSPIAISRHTKGAVIRCGAVIGSFYLSDKAFGLQFLKTRRSA